MSIPQAKPEVHASPVVQQACVSLPQFPVGLSHCIWALQTRPVQQSLVFVQADEALLQHLPPVQLRPRQHSDGVLHEKPGDPQQLPTFEQCKPALHTWPAQQPCCVLPQGALGSMSSGVVMPPSKCLVGKTPGGGAAHAPKKTKKKVATRRSRTIPLSDRDSTSPVNV
jgi:hypothetical protein